MPSRTRFDMYRDEASRSDLIATVRAQDYDTQLRIVYAIVQDRSGARSDNDKQEGARYAE